MGLNKKEEEILKQIEQELMKDDPGLAKTVEDSTLSKFTRNRAVISFFVFVWAACHSLLVSVAKCSICFSLVSGSSRVV